ncbi:MAG: methyltransferase domain-containing protein [Candidatus Heimdallarchaeota archaeon]|nr:methyltransferase domain-containing protein [Candidatus Heimdallarchaeota archaeon]MCG3256299.1 methyltransferase domain-containing protein [Candidatus Heimdallarchaeota archaeon]MCK4611367.1 methyltransferase domain-containing protein [Candidatus Heimdallarchaeota archaeon]
MDLFSRIAKRYDKIIKGFDLSTILDNLTLIHNEVILDLGGGTGRLAVAFEEYVNGCILLDRSFEMINQAKKKSTTIMIVQGVSEALPFRKGSIPQIFANDTLHHIHKQDETIEQCYEILSTSGHLMVREFDPDHWKTRFLIFFEKLLLFGSKFLSPKSLEEICKKYNFTVEWERLTKSTYLLNAKKNSSY